MIWRVILFWLFGAGSIGNMLTNTENGSAAYVYSTAAGTRLPHAVKSANGVNYAYDMCGNMLSRGSQALAYNPEIRTSHANHSTRYAKKMMGRRNSFSAMNTSQNEAKLAYVKLNIQTPCPPRSAVPVNQGRAREAFSLLHLPDRTSVMSATAQLCRQPI